MSHDFLRELGSDELIDHTAEDFKTIRTFAERDNSHIVHWSKFPDGGHFATMERPDVLAEDLRTFFRA